MKAHKIVYVIALATIIAGCASQEAMFKKATIENTVEGYRYFLEKYPDGQLAKIAQKSLIDLEYQAAEKENTIEAYEKFMQKYPDKNSKSYLIADDKIISLEWDKARQINSEESYQKFIQQYPKSNQASIAEERLFELDFEKTKKINELDCYVDFKKKYSHIYKAAVIEQEIENKILDLSFEKAENENFPGIYKLAMRRYKGERTKAELERKLFYLQYKEDLNEIFDSKNDIKKIDAFKSVFSKLSPGTSFNIADFSYFINYLKAEYEINKDKLPYGMNKNTFFYYLASLDYIPTVEGENNFTSFSGSYGEMLEVLKGLVNLYKSKAQADGSEINTEPYYLLHNIARISCLFFCNMTNKDFNKLNFKLIQQIAAGKVFSNAQEAIKKDYDLRVMQFLNESDNDQRERFESTVSQFLVDLQNYPSLNSETKVFILTKLDRWLKIVRFEEASIEILKVVSQKDKDAKVRPLAATAFKNAIR